MTQTELKAREAAFLEAIKICEAWRDDYAKDGRSEKASGCDLCAVSIRSRLEREKTPIEP